MEKLLPSRLSVALVASLIAVGLLALSAGNADAAAQEKARHKLSAAAEAPPEEQEAAQVEKPPKVKPKRGERGHVATSRALRAVREAPPEEQEAAQIEKPPKVKPPRHGLERALERLQRLPDFELDLESLKERGAPVDKLFPGLEGGRKPTGMLPDMGESFSWLAWLNPFAVRRAEAQGWTLLLDDTNGWYSYPPYGSCYFYGESRFTGTSQPYHYMKTRSVSGLGHEIANPYVYILFQAPTDAWYLIDINGDGYSAELQHWNGSAYETVQTFPNEYETVYPALVELEAGYHYFYFVVTGSYVTFYDVQIMRID